MRVTLLGGGLLLLLAVVVLAIDLDRRYLPAARALRDGQDASTQAEEILRGGVAGLDHAQLARVDALLQRAADDFGPRSEVIETSWMGDIGAHLPLVGNQVRAVRALRATGEAGSRLGLDLLPLLDQALPQPNSPPGTTLPRITALAEQHSADLERVVADLDLLRSAAAGLPPLSARLFGPLVRGREIVDREVPRIDAAVRPAVDLLHVLPAAVGPGEHRYLLLLDNPGEQRPGGGFIGSVGEVAFTEGRVVSESFRISDFARPLVTSVPAPRPLDEAFYHGRPLELADANWSPDFPVSAAAVAGFYEKATHEHIDGVIGVDPVALGYVLEVIGPVHVSPYPQQVTATDTLLQLNEIINSARPGDPGKAFLAPFGRTVLDNLLHAPLAQGAGLSSALIRGAREKHVVLQFNDQALQRRADAAGYAGRVSSPLSDALEVVDANVSGSKADLVVTRAYRLVADVTAAGEVHDQLTLRYRNPTQTDPALRSLNEAYGGAYRDYLRIYVPETAHLQGMTLTVGGHTTTVSPEAIDFELGREAIGYLLVVRPGEEATLTVDYAGPFADASQERVSYSLIWSKQIGAAAWPISLELRGAAGTRTVSGDLTEDRSWPPR